MRVKNFSVLFLMGCVTTGMFLSGCAPKHMNLITKKGVSVEAVYSLRVHISDMAVSEDDNEFVITGKVHRRNHSIAGSGHIDVTTLDPAGNVIEKGSAPYTPTTLPKTPGARKHRGSRFEVRLPGVLPSGSKVQVAYHATVKHGSNGYDCERSILAGRPSISK